MRRSQERYIAVAKHRVACLFMAAAIAFPVIGARPAYSLQKPSRQSAIEAFSRGDYDNALHQFGELLSIYPKDPLYKYYSGICMIRLNMNPEKAVVFLSDANKGSAVVRSVPPDVLFWLARAQQMAGQFNEAIKSYNAFTEIGDRKTARDMGIPGYIQQCNEGKGRLYVTDSGEIKPEEKGRHEAVQLKESAGVVARPGQPVTSGYVIPPKYDSILSEALIFQSRADSLYKMAGLQKKKMAEEGSKDKAGMKTRVVADENLALLYQKRADQKYAEARAVIDNISFPGISNQVVTDTLQGDASVNPPASAGKLVEGNLTPRDNEQGGVSEGAKLQVAGDSTEPDRNRKSEPSPVDETPAGISSNEESTKLLVFSVFEEDHNVSYNDGERVIVNPPLPPGLIYRVQVAVFRNPVPASYFRGIAPVSGFKAVGADKTHYYAGMFRRHADAERALAVVRAKGFRDAFIVSLLDGAIVSPERAAVLEKEWGIRPLTSGNGRKPVTRDTLPPTLSFRVEVSRSAKPLKAEIADAIRKISGSRGLDAMKLNDGSIAYLIGKFITFESAEEFAGLLIRNGYRDAKVTAWLDNKEIKVEKARELFEKSE